MSASVQRICFLQLPQLDNDTSGPMENPPLAAHYLRHALERSPEHRYYSVIPCPTGADYDDDHTLVHALLKTRLDVLAGTLYLWNVERFLHIATMVRQRRPGIRILVGGPEVAPSHPFLFRSALVDAAVYGEGEIAFPLVLEALRTGTQPSFARIGWRMGRHYQWGKRTLPPVDLARDLPPPEADCNRPDANGMAYLESTRGCPLRCSFCCYSQHRPHVAFLGTDNVIQRVQILRERGTREIRFIDPTFNTNPDFEAILAALARLNRDHALRFFAEIRADTMTPGQARLLKAAHFTDVEVGIQSRDPHVLRQAGRPTRLADFDRGIDALQRNRIHLTVDIMCGLPGQTLRDIRQSLRWAHALRPATVQFLHTLLLPGTRLREQRKSRGLVGQELPPYRVIRTPHLSPASLRRAERMARAFAPHAPDCPARSFVGTRLPDLFPEQVLAGLDRTLKTAPGQRNRRALVFKGHSMFARRRVIADRIRRAVEQEPHILWQFVLAVEEEEPLDLLEHLVAVLRRLPLHWLDRLSTDPERRHIARRLFVRLSRRRHYSPSWIRATADLLESAFY